MNGGDIVGSVLRAQGVQQLFTLCGGHISPILVAAKREGIRVVDVRDEASAVFAADAVARMTGIPGVAAVTAGPGLTNTLTAVENALLAQTPLIVIGGATATILKGRGALQDIDQMALMRPAVKRAFAVKRVRHIGPVMEQAFRIAQEGVPGPVFVELPVDLLYAEEVVKDWYMKEAGGGTDLFGRVQTAYVRQHLFRVFRGGGEFKAGPPEAIDPMEPRGADVDAAVEILATAKNPVLVIGGQTITRALEAGAVAEAIERLGIPAFLGGTARGLLGNESQIQFRHQRGAALKHADAVIVCGFPFDFRMGYGWKINAKAKIITVNRDKPSLTKNRRPTVAVHGDAGRFLQLLARRSSPGGARWAPWVEKLRAAEQARDDEIAAMAEERMEYINPVDLALQMEARLADDSVIVVDGGDFVATAAYIMKPRRALSWLDPGVYGTLGVGGGFAVGAATVRPGAEVWLIYGDGASAYSLAEIDTLARHGLSVIAVIGNDASWGQIARDQEGLLGDLVGTVLERTAYHTVAEGYGGKGLVIKRPEEIGPALDEAKRLAKAGHPVVINAWLGRSEFRKGSISI
jgi:thiamine pyrophosphate-dependent acetolactate synthase large subunit-like protein